MIRVGLYGRHACAALVLVAAMATAAGARAAWRDPKYHKPEETSKEDFDIVVIDPDAPNAVQVGKTFSQLERDVQVFSVHELEVIADYLDVELPPLADDDETADRLAAERAAVERTESARKAAAEQAETERAAADAEHDRIAAEEAKKVTGTPVDELGFPVLKKLAKQHEIAVTPTTKKLELIAALKDKGVATVAADVLAALTAE